MLHDCVCQKAGVAHDGAARNLAGNSFYEFAAGPIDNSYPGFAISSPSSIVAFYPKSALASRMRNSMRNRRAMGVRSRETCGGLSWRSIRGTDLKAPANFFLHSRFRAVGYAQALSTFRDAVRDDPAPRMRTLTHLGAVALWRACGGSCAPGLPGLCPMARLGPLGFWPPRS